MDAILDACDVLTAIETQRAARRAEREAGNNGR